MLLIETEKKKHRISIDLFHLFRYVSEDNDKLFLSTSIT